MAQQLPEGSYLYEVSAYYNQHTIPRDLRVFTPLPPEFWGVVLVEDGEVNLYLEEAPDKAIRVTAKEPGIIPADTRVRLEATGMPVLFYIRYYHDPKLTDADQLASLLGSGREQPGPDA